VKAVAVLHEGYEPSEALAKEIITFTKGKLAGYKCPKSLDFINDQDMPRTISGKILHRILRERYGTWSDVQ
jgi:fatty-acyl-CoA synthase